MIEIDLRLNMAGIGQNHIEFNLFTYLCLEKNLRAFSKQGPEILQHILQ